ncbi:MAG TPA: hypothetical protein VMA75_05210 [Candidatus Paceibacterota bacterium]|nr:hypothetical protein [Candidatus Paceibacterota bacterium]
MKGARDPGRTVTICLGILWLVDGILQLQPAMFTNAFVTSVLAPTLQGQPAPLAALIAAGINLFAAHIFWSNLASALVQLLIGALLVFPFPRGVQRFGLWLSVAWALIVWVFGEGLGILFTGNATFYTGAPGSALLYAILALCLLFSWHKKLPLVAGIVFLVGVVLNLMPMFWQPTMLSMLVMVPSISNSLGAIGPQGTVIGNLIAVDLLACFGILLLLVPNKAVAWATLVFLLIVWGFGQTFGGIQTFPFATATDPNSAPILALFLLPILLAARATTRTE